MVTKRTRLVDNIFAKYDFESVFIRFNEKSRDALFANKTACRDVFYVSQQDALNYNSYRLYNIDCHAWTNLTSCRHIRKLSGYTVFKNGY